MRESVSDTVGIVLTDESCRENQIKPCCVDVAHGFLCSRSQLSSVEMAVGKTVRARASVRPNSSVRSDERTPYKIPIFGHDQNEAVLDCPNVWIARSVRSVRMIKHL